jgi:hypothetical protein
MLLRGWRALLQQGLSLNSLLGSLSVALLFVALKLGPGVQQRWSLLGAGVMAGLAWLGSLRRARAIAELATSRIGSAAQGYGEFVARISADNDNLIFSPMSAVPCIWYRFKLYSKDNSKHEWRQIDSGVSSATFEIKDATGACRVDPDFAEVVAPHVRTSYPGNDKLVEEFLFAGSDIYVLGDFVTLGETTTALNVRQDVSDLLATWKQDRVGLLQRFDLDRNGIIDQQEWEQARQLALHTVAQQHHELRQRPCVNLLKAPVDGRLFLISTLSPHALRQRFMLWSALHFALAMAALTAWVYTARIA